MGCFVSGYAEACERMRATLRLRTDSVCCFTSAQSAVILAAAHIRSSCGAIAECYVWENIAYQVGGYDSTSLEAVGPFVFESSLCEAGLLAASEFDGAE